MGASINLPEDPEAALKRRKLELEISAAERENDLRARKLAAEAELAEKESPERLRKLTADLAVSTRQASRQWLLIEWLKAGTVPVALLGLISTVFVSFFQLDHARKQFEEQVSSATRQASILEKGRRLERLDKAVEKLMGESVAERVAAITTLKLLLAGDARDTDRPALVSLVDRLALETDPVVQAVIVRVFDTKILQQLETSAIDAALATAAERSRLLRRLAQDSSESTPARSDRLFEASRSSYQGAVPGLVELLSKASPTPVYSREAMYARQVRYRPSDILQVQLSEPESNRLVNLSRVLESLFSSGARHEDLSEIYCPECDFQGSTTARSASGTIFRGAVLDRATFNDIDLSKADFTSAHILGVSFLRVDLRGARISMARDSRFVAGAIEVANGGSVSRLPVSFACSDVTGASLSNVPLVAVNVTVRRNVLLIEIAASGLSLAHTDGNSWGAGPLVVYYSIDSSPISGKDKPDEETAKEIFQWIPISKPVELKIASDLSDFPGSDFYAHVISEGKGAESHYKLMFLDLVNPSEKFAGARFHELLSEVLGQAGIEYKGAKVIAIKRAAPDFVTCRGLRAVVHKTGWAYGRVPWTSDDSSLWKKYSIPDHSGEPEASNAK